VIREDFHDGSETDLKTFFNVKVKRINEASTLNPARQKSKTLPPALSQTPEL
jgi:hypothetical protein